MKLLILEVNLSRGEITAELLYGLDRHVQMLSAITLASDLQMAVLCLPEHDAVLCDGTFPPATRPSGWRSGTWCARKRSAGAFTLSSTAAPRAGGTAPARASPRPRQACRQ